MIRTTVFCTAIIAVACIYSIHIYIYILLNISFFFLLDFRKDKETILVFSLIAKGDLNIVKRKKNREMLRVEGDNTIRYRIYILEFCDPYDVILAVCVRCINDSSSRW